MAEEDRRKRFRGYTEDEIAKLDYEAFLKLIPSRERRTLKRGLSHTQKRLLETLQKKGTAKTHSRDMIIVPEMLGKTVQVHNGKQYVDVRVELEMLGGRLGEYAVTRKRVSHQAPGIGATRSSAHMSVK